MDYLKELNISPSMELLSDIVVNGIMAGLYCMLNSNADPGNILTLTMMVSILYRVIIIERNTAAKVNG